MINLLFRVTHQTITRLDTFKVVADVRNYHKAQFFFSVEWKGLVKHALFKKGDETWEVTLVDNKCDIPNSCFVEPGVLEVSVYGGDLITVNIVKIPILKSGYSEIGVEPPVLEPIEFYVKTPLTNLEENEKPIHFIKTVDGVLFQYDGEEWRVVKGAKGDPGELEIETVGEPGNNVLGSIEKQDGKLRAIKVEAVLARLGSLPSAAERTQTKSTRLNSNLYLDTGTESKKVTLQDIKGMSTKILVKNNLIDESYKNLLDAGDFIFLAEDIE